MGLREQMIRFGLLRRSNRSNNLVRIEQLSTLPTIPAQLSPHGPPLSQEKAPRHDRVICVAIEGTDKDTEGVVPALLEIHSHNPDQPDESPLLDEMTALLMGASSDDVYYLFFQPAYRAEDRLKRFIKNQLEANPLLALVRNSVDNSLLGYVVMGRKLEQEDNIYVAAAYMCPEYRCKGLLTQSLKQIFSYSDELGLVEEGRVLFSYNVYNSAMLKFCYRLSQRGCDIASTGVATQGVSEKMFSIGSARRCFT